MMGKSGRRKGSTKHVWSKKERRKGEIMGLKSKGC